MTGNGVTTCQVANAADLDDAISQVNTNGSSVNVIEFTANVSVSSSLAPITSAGTVFIKGNDHALMGNGSVALLHVGDNGGGNTFVQIGDLNLTNGVASGASANGGALYVDTSGQVVLKNVTLSNDRAQSSAGDALGGAIYVASGGSLNINGDSVVSGSSVMATGGTAAGKGLFLGGSGMLTLNVSSGQTLSLQDDISDTKGVFASTGSWSLFIKGDGGAPVDTSDPAAGRAYGLVELGGANTYTGGTLIQGANVGVNNMGALGSSGAVTLDDGGLVVAGGVDISRDIVLLSDSRVGVASGQAALINNITGSDSLTKVGAGDLALQLLPTSNFSGNWIVNQGGLLLDGDNRLGSSKLTLDGGGIGFLAAFTDLRSFSVTSQGGYVDNRGFDVSLGNAIQGWDQGVTLTFRDSQGGMGVTRLLAGTGTHQGDTEIESGTVVGNIAQGELSIDAGGVYQLGGANRQISALKDGTSGSGRVDLGSNGLTINLNYDNSGSSQSGGGLPFPFPGGGSGGGSGSATSPSFSGAIVGSGNLIIASSGGLPSPWSTVSPPDVSSFRTQGITGTGNSTQNWSTTVTAGAFLHVTSAASLGSGTLTLQNGALESDQNFSKDINLAGNVGIFHTAHDLTFSGRLTGSADFLKAGDGILTLTGDNSMLTGDMVVAGDTSRIAASAANQLGSGNLVLVDGGGLTLLGDISHAQQMQLASGIGSVDTNGHDMQVGGAVSGGGTLSKAGNGSLILTGNVSSGISIGTGVVQLGDGDHGGSVNAAIDIVGGARLVVDRNDSLPDLALNQSISGAGAVVKQGSGLLSLAGSNSFSGGLTVNEGYVSGNSDAAYGSGTILLDGGGLKLVSNLSRNVELGSNNGSLQVATGSSYHFSGQLTGNGALAKTGTGTLIYTGLGSQSMALLVNEGTFQVGEGSLGALLGNVSVATGATLAFARDDLTQYGGVIDGAGDVVKNGNGELVLTGDQLFTGNLHIETGSVRLGYGGTTGSLAGSAELDANTQLVVDHTGVATIGGSLLGSGTLRNVGTAQLFLPGNSSVFTGTTQVENGSLRVDGILGGDASLAYGTWLQGSGSILGNLTFANGAEFRPGNSIGTFAVGGNLALNAGSRLTIEMDDAGHSDKVVVGGQAGLAGTLQLKPQAGTYTTGCCTYTVLTASNGLNGTHFDQVLNDLAFLTAQVQYQPNSVIVTLARNGNGNNPGGNGFTLTGLTWNQRQVQSGLNALDPTNPLVALVTPLTTTQARSAYDDLSGDVYLNQSDAVVDISRNFGRLLASRTSRLGLASRGSDSFAFQEPMTQMYMGQLPDGASQLNYNGPTSTLEGGWVQVSPVLLTQAGDADVGSAASSLRGTLLSLGADGHWTDELIGGFGLGYLQGSLDYDNRSSSGDVNGVLAGVYARWNNASGWQYKGAVTLGSFNTSMQRSVTVGSGTYLTRASGGLKTVGVDGELGYAWLTGSYAVRPYLLANLQYLKRDALSEGGSLPVDLELDAANNKLSEAGVGVELSRPWLTDGRRWAQLQGGMALVMPFGDTQLAQATHFGATVPTYTVKATANNQPALQLTLGAEWYLTPKLSLWGGYEGRISNMVKEHNGMMSLQYRW